MSPYAKALADVIDLLVDAHTDFRSTGREPKALNYPLTKGAWLWLCAYNGVDPAEASWTYRFASSEAMRVQIERMAIDLSDKSAP